MVIKKLPSNFFVQLHTGIIDHAIDRVSKLDPDEQAAERAKALQVFKGLVLMLKNLTPHEAQQM